MTSNCARVKYWRNYPKMTTWDGYLETMKEDEYPECAPAMCAAFVTKSFWEKSPKLYSERLFENPSVQEREISAYMRRNNLETKPLLFSEGSRNRQDMICAIPKEHVDKVVVMCKYDSVGPNYWKNEDDTWKFVSFPSDPEQEISGTIGQLYGEYFKTLAELDYWRIFNIPGENQDDGKTNIAGEVWDVGAIGISGSMLYEIALEEQDK
ncbi:hypothetical protein BKA69DRAFT_1087318 [Paraphysoderma sedebokerense]|nr:hypothetical protein BKA69DRAFT_1087318 [Paraphysoderma sedebokerense]